MTERDKLKQHCLSRLDECALEHPSGHQGKLAARYLLRRSAGDVAELMFEKGPKTKANLWVAHKQVASLISEPGLRFQSLPASVLFSAKGKNGKPIYGRHSALRSMRELEHGDLICFEITSDGELDRILGHLGG